MPKKKIFNGFENLNGSHHLTPNLTSLTPQPPLAPPPDVCFKYYFNKLLQTLAMHL